MSDLQRVVKLGELLVERQEALARAEAMAAEIKAEVMRLEREDLPNLMSEIGVSDVTLSSGKKITIKEDCDARISEANRPAAFAWLMKNGYGGIIKTFVSVQFGKGGHDEADAAAALLRSQFNDRLVELDESVHPSTLKAFVKERLAAGEAMPLDVFGVYVYNKAVIKN